MYEYIEPANTEIDESLLHETPTATIRIPAEQGTVITEEAMAPHSLQNPYYGYPVTISSSTAAASSSTTPGKVYHVRRRKRDLIRTLTRLFWLRWRKHLTASLLFLVLFLTVTLLRKIAWMRRWRWPISSASALLGLVLQLPPATLGVGMPLNPAIPVN